MAKWGEGDPRWIVEERPDAINVNNWHWTEKDASAWSSEQIKSLLSNASIETDESDILLDVDKCDGEASVNNRKGKLIFFYEWTVILKWTGQLQTSSTMYSGTIELHNFSEEYKADELQITVSTQENDEHSERLKQLIKKHGPPVLRNQIRTYIDLLKEEYSKGVILPKKDNVDIDPTNIIKLSSDINKVNMNSVVESRKNDKQSFTTDTIKMQEKFQCTGQEMYDALTKYELVTAFTRSTVKLELSVGGQFELFNGNIIGSFLELIPSKKIVQRWRNSSWPKDHYSIVTFNIKQESDHTMLDLIQSGVPKEDISTIRRNWERYYWDPIKRTLGFGAFIM